MENRAPAVLLPYQQRWIADNSPVRVAEKSRRVGLSWAQAAESALAAASQNGMDTWYIGYNQDMAREFVNDVGNWARHFNCVAAEMEEVLLDDEDKNIRAYRVTFASGKRVTALSSRPTNLRGKQGLVVIDEAAFHGELEELLKAAMALLIWGGRVAIISTHNGDTNPFNNLVADIRAGKRPYSLHRIDFDEALSQGLYQRICLKTGTVWTSEAQATWRQSVIDFYGDAAQEELFCVPKGGSGAYLTRVVIEQCMQRDWPVLRLRCPPDYASRPEAQREADVARWIREVLEPELGRFDRQLRTSYGMDFGRVADLSVIVPVQSAGGLRVPLIVELRGVPFRQQEQVLFRLVDLLPRFQGGAHDATGNGQYLAEVAMQRYGSAVEQVKLSAEWYRSHMPRLKAALEDGELSLPYDEDVMNDLRSIRMVSGVPRVPENARHRGADGELRHGDAAVAMALAVYATTLEGAPVEFEAWGVRQSSSLSDFMMGE